MWAAVTDHFVDRNVDFGCFFVINLVEMLDVQTSTPALSTQFITKNHLKIKRFSYSDMGA